MVRYLTEYDRHLAFLTSAYVEEQERAHALARDLDSAEHALSGTDEVPDQNAHDTAVTTTTQDSEYLDGIWDERHTEAKDRVRRR